jgi:hypothetical protein
MFRLNRSIGTKLNRHSKIVAAGIKFIAESFPREGNPSPNRCLGAQQEMDSRSRANDTVDTRPLGLNVDRPQPLFCRASDSRIGSGEQK